MPKLKTLLPSASFVVNVEGESCAVEELLYHALKVPGFAGRRENLATHLSTSLSPQSYMNETSVHISTPVTKTCVVLLIDHCSNIKKISNVRPTAVEMCSRHSI